MHPDAETEAVIAYYDTALKKHQRRLRNLERRGEPEQRLEESKRSIRKYEIVLAALTTDKEQPK